MTAIYAVEGVSRKGRSSIVARPLETGVEQVADAAAKAGQKGTAIQVTLLVYVCAGMRFRIEAAY
jgi:hypothetical protein